MAPARRTVLAVLGGVVTAGCSGRSDDDPAADAPPDSDTPQCDPADVSRPPVTTGTNLDGRPYPQKPETLTNDAILVYLDDFETSFAWNRVLQSAADVTSLNIDNLDGFVPDETGDGYLASSGITVSYSTADGSTTERTYIANYFVTPGPVYRHESTSEPVALEPQDTETVLVQCGAGT